MFELKFGRVPKSYRPGETLDAAVHWSSEETGKSFTVRIRWFTIGKGSTSSLVVHQEVVPLNSASGVFPVPFKLPRGPLSCEGKLITIQWAVEVELSKPKRQIEELFYLGYAALPIRLDSFPVAEEKKKPILTVS